MGEEKKTASYDNQAVYAGRNRLILDAKEVTTENIVELLDLVLPAHIYNANQIEYLYRYCRGVQPILTRKKIVRPEINNMIVENRANEIVSFKTGYLMGEPVQYVARSEKKEAADGVKRVNEMVFSEDKEALDKELADWMHICGTAFRICLPDSDPDTDEAPFEIYTADPRTTFVVYSNKLGNPPLFGCTARRLADGEWLYSIYTETHYYEVVGARVVKDQAHALGMIPIIEYPANSARLGAFEVVLPLLDAINALESNRLDDVEQTVQALLLFHNVDISSDDYKSLREQGAIKYKDIDAQLKADIKYITANMSQGETQTLSNNLYKAVLEITGMPNRNGGSSTSDTGAAVIMRDGWSAAEARAKDTELMFKRSEKQFLKLLLRICRDSSDGVDLVISDIEIRFTRRNYENILSKAQVLTQMLDNDKIAPILAFTHCGLFSDPQVAYRLSKDYMDSKENKTDGPADSDAGDPSQDGAGDSEGADEGAQRRDQSA